MSVNALRSISDYLRYFKQLVVGQSFVSVSVRTKNIEYPTAIKNFNSKQNPLPTNLKEVRYC